jgi:hypothetical protein
MFLERPHVRTEGIYVSRNTYIRLGATEWRVKNPVHLVRGEGAQAPSLCQVISCLPDQDEAGGRRIS